MTENILKQLARTDLLPTEVSAEIFRDNPPALVDLVSTLLMSAGDCHFATLADTTSTWHHKRASRGLLIATYLLALGLDTKKPRPTDECSNNG